MKQILAFLVMGMTLVGCGSDNPQALKAVNFEFSGPETGFSPNTCFGPVLVKAIDKDGKAASLDVNVDVALSTDSPNMMIYSDSSCSTQITNSQITVSQGSSNYSVYLKDSFLEKVSFELQSTFGHIDALVSMVPGQTQSLLINGISSALVASANCVGPFYVTAEDSNNYFTSELVNLSSQNAGVYFYSDSACSQQIRSISTRASVASQYAAPPMILSYNSDPFYVGFPAIIGSYSLGASIQSNSGLTQSYSVSVTNPFDPCISNPYMPGCPLFSVCFINPVPGCFNF